MLTPSGSPLSGPASGSVLRRSLVRLRQRGEPVGIVELAQRLLSLRAPLPAGLARRIVAEALGRPASALPERLEPRDLRPAEELEIADVALGDARFAVVDLETTGLSRDRAHILEIGAVRVVALQRGERFETLVRPPGSITRSITALTGIHDALVADAPTPLRALRSFRTWLERGAPAPFVAHNARFDAGFVARALREQRLPAYSAPVLCTRRLARRLLPRLGRYGLDPLCAHFGISNPARHRGPGDAEATAQALIELLELARSQVGIRTVGELLDFQEAPPPRRPRRRRPLS